jgi:carboxymethylenebutenolidase
MGAYLARPAASGKRPGLIVAHELFGVNADIRAVVDRWAELGYVAVAPEFYHRDERDGVALERDEAGRKRGFELLHRLTRESVVADVTAVMRELATRAETDGRVGMVGFSMGGHIAYLAATALELTATAALYAGWLTSRDIPLSQPEPTVTLTSGIADRGGRLLFIVGGKDRLVDRAQIDAIETALSHAGVSHRVLVLPDAEHAFFWENTPSFHASSREEAWRALHNFFADAFG